MSEITINTEKWTAEDRTALENLIANNEPKGKKWVPKAGERYLYIEHRGKIDSDIFDDDSVDQRLLTAGHLYPLDLKHVAEADARVRKALYEVRTFAYESGLWDGNDSPETHPWYFGSYDVRDDTVQIGCGGLRVNNSLPRFKILDEIGTVEAACRAETITVLSGGRL